MVLYRDLRDKEVRVIKLFTDQDDPKFASGPVHCSLEYVTLEEFDLKTNEDRKRLTKGCNGTWPCPPAEDIEAQPGWQDILWRKSVRQQSSSHRETRTKEALSSNGLAKGFEVTDKDAQLPWRYEWGDYVALSYVWGDPAIKRTIFVDNTPVAVTENLEAALCQLRNYSRIKQGFRIWVDAVCINQEDLKERARQVARMKHIYDSARHVVIWLGMASNESDIAMTGIRYLSLRSQEDDPLKEVYHRVEVNIINIPYMHWRHSHIAVTMRKEVFRAIYYLLARPYFRRLWVIQELVSGTRNTPILCGTKCVLLDDIYRSLILIRDMDGNELGRQIMRSTNGYRGLEQSWDQFPVGIDTYTISEKLWERPIAMIEAQDAPQTPGKTVVHNNILGALILGREANTSDDRDRVYGILGIPSLAAVIKLVPSYEITAAYTYIIFAKSLFESGDLNCLRLVASPVPPIDTKYLKFASMSRPRAPKFPRCPEVVNSGCEHGLPSWVTCWSCPRNPAINLPSHPSSALEAYYVPPAFRDDKLMTVRGIIFDTVNSLTAFHATESDRSYPFNGQEIQSIYGSEAGTLEAFWRTITSNTTRSGEPLPSSWSILLEPRNWDVGSRFSSRGIFGLNDFFARNKSMKVFDRTLAQLLTPAHTLASRVKNRNLEEDAAYFNLRSTDRQILRDATLWAMQVLAWRRLITTKEGYMGLAPAATKAGDIIAIIPGCDVPLILHWEGAHYRVLGESYVHGVLLEEVAKMLEQGTKRMVDITLN